MTKVYNTQDEINADIKHGVLEYNGDIVITFDCKLDAHIKAMDIYAMDIEAWDIKALSIKARNIYARDIKAHNINAWNIRALSIKAQDINYFASCISFERLACKTIVGRYKNSIHKCLDSEIEFIKEL